MQSGMRRDLNEKHSLYEFENTTDELLSQLRPSKKLLEYYQKKISDYRESFEELLEKVEECKSICVSTSNLVHEIQQKNEEISTLQESLSDVQVYLYREREQVLKLYAENDALQIQQYENAIKIRTLLALSGTTESDLLYIVAKAPPHVPVKHSSKLPEHRERKLQNSRESNKSSARIQTPKDDFISNKSNDVLALEVKSLTAQIEEMSVLHHDQIETLMKDREITRKEHARERVCLQEQITSLSQRLKEAQDKATARTKDLISLTDELHARELAWNSERDQLKSNLQLLQEQVGDQQSSVRGYSVLGGVRPKKPKEVDTLKEQLEQGKGLLLVYQEQCFSLKETIRKLRNEADRIKLQSKNKVEQLTSTISYWKKKHNDLEVRRKLEMEGFQNDIKRLRVRVTELERRILRWSAKTDKKSSATKLSDDYPLLTSI